MRKMTRKTRKTNSRTPAPTEHPTISHIVNDVDETRTVSEVDSISAAEVAVLGLTAGVVVETDVISVVHRITQFTFDNEQHFLRTHK